MTPADVLCQAKKEGVQVTLSPAGKLRVGGEPSAVNRWRTLLAERKVELVELLNQPAREGLPRSPAIRKDPDCVPSRVPEDHVEASKSEQHAELSLKNEQKPAAQLVPKTHISRANATPLSRVVRATEQHEVPRANIAIGLPCGRCRGKLYAPAPGGFAWPDGSKDAGWRCIGCGAVYLFSGKGVTRQDQESEKLSDLFRQLPAGHFVSTKED